MNNIFDYFKEIFNLNGFRLYMVGGTSRDYLLNNKIDDYDFVSDATPNDVKKFLNFDDTFSRFGVMKIKFEKKDIEITTLREEGDYKDKRHPSYIKFIKDINIDYKRRDFTINAIYIDENYNILDPSNLGINDLKNKVLRFIGNPLKRIKEDPLRILRGKRFAHLYNLYVDEELQSLFYNYEYLLDSLNKEKIKEELKKDERIINKE